MKNFVSNSGDVAFLCNEENIFVCPIKEKAFLSHAEMDFEWDYKLDFLLKCDNNGAACNSIK